MRRILILSLSTIIIVLGGHNLVFGATVNVDTANRVVGIEALDVGAYGTFDVNFYYGSYTDIWGSGFDFSGEEAVHTAIDAMNTALNSLSIIPPMIWYVAYSEGLFDGASYSYWIPFLDTESGVRLHRAVNVDGDLPDAGWLPDMESTITRDGVWAGYTVFSPVPIPGAVWLLGSGLIGIVGIRRKINK